MRLLAFFLFFVTLPSHAQVELQGRALTNSDGAVCNSGSAASIYEANFGYEKWAVIFQGGGSAKSPNEFLRRASGRGTLTKSLFLDLGIKKIEKGFVFDSLKSNGFNIAWVPYCSSDAYLGDHFHSIGKENVPFKGDLIFKAVIQDLAPKLNEAKEVLIGGWSAGAIGVSAHLDYLKNNLQTNVRLLFDGYWLDESELQVRSKWNSNDQIKFLTKSLPTQCASNWLKCFPSAETLTKNSYNDAFIVWNVGDSYRRSLDDELMQSSIKTDISFFGGGISLGSEFPIRGVLGAHVVLFSESYEQTFDGKKPKKVFENWLNNNNESILINHKKIASNNLNMLPITSSGGDKKQIFLSKFDIDSINNSKALVLLTTGADCRNLDDWSEQLTLAGFSSLSLDHCSSRSLNRSRLTNLSGYTSQQRVYDLTTAINYLINKGLKDMPLVVMSFAQGAAALNEISSDAGLAYLEKQNINLDSLKRIDAFISFYPFCTTPIPSNPIRPYLVNIAGKDDVAGGMFCQNPLEGKKGNLHVVTYKNAHHGFDQKGVNINSTNRMGSKYRIQFDQDSYSTSIKQVTNFINSVKQ